jgi:hypothetical protein
MNIKQLDALVHDLATYFTGPDVPLNQNARSINKGGRYQLRERADRFFKVREQLGISGMIGADQAEIALRRRLGL